MRWRTWRWAILALAATAGVSSALNGRQPGSVLIYPIHYSGSGFTLLSVTNTALDSQPPLVLGGSTNIAWNYINLVPGTTPLLPLDCTLSDRVESLTPADTRTVLTGCHNAAGDQEGFVLVSAQDPRFFKTDWSHNFLIGSGMVVNQAGGIFVVDAIPFESPQPPASDTDGVGDGDGQIDFDGIEYEGVPDDLYADSFMAAAGSSLTLLNLSGGARFRATVGLDVWNDNEYPMSLTLQFRCSFEEPLADLSPIFTQTYLANNTPHDPAEFDVDCDQVGDLETGWFRVRGLEYSSSVETCLNPALLGAITAGPDTVPQPVDGGRLLWESKVLQPNGDFYGFATDSPECPELGPPRCDAGGPYAADEGESITFDGTGSSDPDGTIVRYDWDFGDGVTAPDAGPTPTHTYASWGDYVVTLTVTDDSGESASCTSPVSINCAPVCPLAPPVAITVLVGETVQLDDTGATDKDGVIVRWDWDFGDGTTAPNAGSAVSHVYAQPGSFTVTVTVTDDDGARSTCTVALVDVVTPNQSPVCDANGPYPCNLGDSITFDGTGSFDPDGMIVRYDWDFGDGSSALAAGPTPTHVYAAPGDYVVTLSVTDDDGATSVCSPAAVTINAEPVCDAGGPYSGNLGDSILFDGTGSFDPVGTVVRYDWDFGDGVMAIDAGPTPVHTYAAAGAYTVTLSVTDGCGAVATCTDPVTVNGPPLCDAGGPYMADLFDEVTFDGSGSSDPDGMVDRWDWDFGDGSSAMDAGPNPTHTYTDYGQFTVTLTVTDDFGRQEACQVTIDIASISGALVFSGDDTDDHCAGNLCGNMAPALIQWVLDHSENQGQGILALGLPDVVFGPMGFSQAKLVFDTWMMFLTPVIDPAPLAGEVRHITDPAEFMALTQADFDSYRMIFIPSFEEHTSGGIARDMIDAMILRKADLEEYWLRRGGGLYALTQADEPTFTPPYTNGWDWSPIPFTTTDVRFFDVCPTTEGLMGTSLYAAPLPGTQCVTMPVFSASSLTHEAYHNVFHPDTSFGFFGLDVFVNEIDPLIAGTQATIIGGIPSPPQFPAASHPRTPFGDQVLGVPQTASAELQGAPR